MSASPSMCYFPSAAAAAAVVCLLFISSIGAPASALQRKVFPSIRTSSDPNPNPNPGPSSSSSSTVAGWRYTADADLDRVHELPGWGPIQGFNMFSGYITVDAAHGRALFYILVESSRSPRSDPLLLWLNGGPGCSSIGGGFMSELGPFLPTKDGRTLQANPYAWNRVANMVFLEVPAFVGFSYSNRSSDRAVGDDRVAEDAHIALLGLMRRFPHLKDNDLFLSGESYAGHYVPMLARRIVQVNAQDPTAALPIKGFLVGNPSTDRVTDRLGAADFLWAHGLISDETAEDIRQACAKPPLGYLGSRIKEQLEQDGVRVRECTAAFDKASREMGPINIYEIYADVCLLPAAARRELLLTVSSTLGQHTGAAAAMWGLSSLSSLKQLPGASGQRGADRAEELPEEPKYDPCVDTEVETYLNLAEVQRALHANQSVILPWRWTDCSDLVDYHEPDLWHNMVPVYEELLTSGSLQILVFSGDVDGMVPLVGTRRWISGLGLKVQHNRGWRPWFSETQQVGGYVIKYEGLTFATIRNAGHMVPYVQPERMFHLLGTFLDGGSA